MNKVSSCLADYCNLTLKMIYEVQDPLLTDSLAVNIGVELRVWNMEISDVRSGPLFEGRQFIFKTIHRLIVPLVNDVHGYKNTQRYVVCSFWRSDLAV
jgi:hypothetical protein